MARRVWIGFALAGSIAMAGCAGLNLKRENLSFSSPAVILGMAPVDPAPEELRGITLRYIPLAAPEIKAEENLKIYSQMHGGSGLSLNLRQKTTIRMIPVAGKDSFIQNRVTTFESEGGRLTETSEVSPRGEILRFIEGTHESRAGKFRILNESRSPVFPENPVRAGDQWHYSEKTELRLESLWIKEKNPTPYLIEAQSELTGFAMVNGHRCAVIKTTAVQTKSETLKVIFKTVTANIRAEITETNYFDYRQGLSIAKVTVTSSRSVMPDLGKEDTGVSQAIYRVVNR